MGNPEQKEEAYFAARIRNRFWGGYEGAGRAMLGVFPDWMEPETGAFPIVGCTFTYPAAYELTHRDFLGSLMCQQLRRELIGDIVVTPGEAYVFADDRVEKVLLTQMDRIGRVGVGADHRRAGAEKPSGCRKRQRSPFGRGRALHPGKGKISFGDRREPDPEGPGGRADLTVSVNSAKQPEKPGSSGFSGCFVS